MHEPVGRVHFVVFEKFTSAYLFQIAQEISCDYLLKIYMKKCEMVKQKKLMCITESGKYCTIKCTNQGARLIWKEKISLVLTKHYRSLANHNPEFLCVICAVLHSMHCCIYNWCYTFCTPSKPIRMSNFLCILLYL